MYRATGEAAYLTKAETIYSQNIAGLPLKWTHNWDDKTYGATVLLAELTGKAVYKTAAEKCGRSGGCCGDLKLSRSTSEISLLL
jgi:hypothetical protein